jgi:hypothetical protein
VPIGDAKVSIMTSALTYGLAVFEGIRAYRDQAGRRLLVFRLADHLERFWRNGRILCMEPPVSRETVAEMVVELLCDAKRFAPTPTSGPVVQVGVRDRSARSRPPVRRVPLRDVSPLALVVGDPHRSLVRFAPSRRHLVAPALLSVALPDGGVERRSTGC